MLCVSYSAQQSLVATVLALGFIKKRAGLLLVPLLD